MEQPSPPLGTAVTEEPVPGDFSFHTHPDWSRRHPWLAQGVTNRGSGSAAQNMGLFTDEPARFVLDRWTRFREAVGVAGAVHAHQVHGATVRVHGPGAPGLHLAEPCDGHLTRAAGRLLAVTVADCVPVTLVSPDSRAVAVVHAGWRGVAKGIAVAALGAFRDRFDVRPHQLEVHLGPAICGDCYEVGPEVHRDLGLPEPAGPTPVDLRAVLAARLGEAGVPVSAITRSTWCTRCGESPFFSHRGGDPERQIAFAGVRG